MKSKKHCDFARPGKVEAKMQAREAYRGGSRRQPYSRSSQPAASVDGPLGGTTPDVLAPAVELIPGADQVRWPQVPLRKVNQSVGPFVLLDGLLGHEKAID
jgi:hypothetical protein